MIVKKKDLRDARHRRDSRGHREYWVGDPVLFTVVCNGIKLKSKFIRWWDCKVYVNKPKGRAVAFNFSIPQGKWLDKWMLETLEKAFNNGGKYKLIQTMFEASE